MNNNRGKYAIAIAILIGAILYAWATWYHESGVRDRAAKRSAYSYKIK